MYRAAPLSKTTSAATRARLPIMLAIALCAGCGRQPPERAAVRGRVTFRGKVVQNGTIVFSPTGGTKGAPAGADIVQGNFSIDVKEGPIVGHHRVEIQAFRKTGNKIPDLLGDVSDPNRPLIDEVVPLLPPKFNLQSKLTAEIKPGDNVVNFNL